MDEMSKVAWTKRNIILCLVNKLEKVKDDNY